MLRLAVLSPLVLAADLLLLLRSEVVLDVERLADLLGGLALDHVGDSLAADVKESLDVEVVGCENDLEEHLLVDLHEFLIPLIDVCGLLAGIGIVIGGRWWVILVLLAPLDDLLQHDLVDIRDGDRLSGSLIREIIKQVLDEDATLGDLTFDKDVDVVAGGKSDVLDGRHLDGLVVDGR